ncbi:MAG: pyridoxamine 5'-phosphate oxidase family protein [Deltaproteobacteria bacterium]|nr:pyridoxamine 5'-phosphate oxidase family protein [Deltaproteobacteria bacterium]MBW2414769.1 pyridoxamine 5'-phosphate oxidase family protein [Deltaproteobacteria bacterium]
MSRRDQIRLTDDEIRDYLSGKKTVILTSNGPDGFPHTMPMWFSVDDEGAICMTTFAKSQKVKNLQRDPRCTLLAESGVEYQELKGVVMYGNAEIIEEQDRIVDTLMTASAGGVPDDPEQEKALRANMARTASKRVLIRLRPDRVVSWDHAKLGGVY